MQRVERTIDEELDYMEEIFEARDEVLEERRLLGAGHIEEDEDYLYNLERARLQASAANLLIGEVVQSRRRPLLGPSPG